MSIRLNLRALSSAAVQALCGLEAAVNILGLEKSLRELNKAQRVA